MKMRKLIALFLIFSFCRVYCQVDSITMVGIAQKKSNLCWAACMETIMKKYDNSLPDQCALSIENYRVVMNITGIMNESLCPCSTICDYNNGNSCNKTVNDSLFVKKFSDNKFLGNATKTYPINFGFPWDTIKKQIRDSTPFIMVVKFGVSASDCKSTHAVIGFGIEDDFIKYIDLKSESVDCATKRKMIPYRNTSSSVIGKPCRFVYNIKPNAELTETIRRRRAMPAPLAIRSNNIAAKSIGSNETFLGAIKKKVSNKELNNLEKSNDYIVVPVKFISYSKTLGDSNGNKKLDDLIVNKKFVDVIYTKPPYTVTTMQKICFKWHPILITNFDENLDYNTTIDSNKVFVNKKNINANNKGVPISYIVKYEDLGYQFYQYKSNNNNKSYLIPFANYQNFLNGDTVKEGAVYKELDITKTIKTETKKQNESFISEINDPKKSQGSKK